MSVCWKPAWCECPDCGPLTAAPDDQPTAPDTDPRTHRPGSGGLFGNRALCEATYLAEPDDILRLDEAAYNCAECARLSGERG